MDVLQAIQYIIQSWNDVTTETICNYWHHTKILPNTGHLDNIEIDNDTEDNEISKMLEIINLSNSMEVKELLNIPEEKIICEIPEDDQIITKLIEIFKKKSDENTDNLNEMDYSNKVVTVSSSVALKNLTTIHTFLL